MSIETNFVVADTKAASKLNIVVYINPENPNDFYIQQRYKKIGGEIVTNWLNSKRERIDFVPQVSNFNSVVAL